MLDSKSLGIRWQRLLEWRMNRRRSVSWLSGGILLLIVLPWMSGCSFRQAGREAAESGFDAGKEAARKWWTEEGKDAATRLGKDLVDAGKVALEEKAQEQREEIEKRLDSGTATPGDIALYILLGGMGAGGTRKLLDALIKGTKKEGENA